MQIDDSTPIYTGLFNEIVSSSIVRYLPVKQKENEQEESKDAEWVKLDEVNQNSKMHELPQGLDETLLATMT